MNWEDERYVRVYTRDTADLLAVGWEGRLVLYELLRKADRAGVLPTSGDLDVIPELLRVPVEVFAVGIERLRKRGVVEVNDAAIIIPNYLAAQEAKQSDRARQRESRHRRVDIARSQGQDARVASRPDRYGPVTDVTNRDPVTAGHSGSQRVTNCDPDSDQVPDVTNRDPIGSQNVTNGHSGSQRVTAGHSVPSRTVPSHLKDPNLHERAPVGPEGPVATGSSSPIPDGPPPWTDADAPPPPPDRRRMPPPAQQQRPTGGAIPGSVASVPRICSKCRQPAPALVEHHGRLLCRPCNEPPAPTEEERAAALRDLKARARWTGDET